MTTADLRGWPQSLVEIAELIGVPAALKLVDAYGGIGCYVPHRIAADHPLIQAIGPAAAARLVSHYAGERLEVPVLAVARARKRLIAEASGRTSDVARRFGVTGRWVRAIRQRSAPDPRQPGLFDKAD